MTNLVSFLCGDKIFKRLFSSTLLLILLGFLFLGNVQNAFAIHTEGHGTGVGPANPLPVTSYGPGQSFPSGVGGGNSVGVVGTGGGQTINQVTGATPASDAAKAEAPVPVIPTVGGTHDPILIVLHGIVTAVGWVAGQFGYMFDYAISNYIVGFGDKYINYNIGNVIDNLWSTVRDIFNLTFIFGLVYIGFKMILDSGDSSARKMLVSLIGAALLVNFSLFITKFVVDFSNIAAYQIYKAFAGSAANGDFSLTRAFMNQMGIDSLFSVPYVEGYQYILGLLIVFLVLAYVFLAGAIMIIIRFVVLNIYMVFSPLMFLGWVFPAMKGYSTKYWSGFLSQAFFAPAFLFMLYLSYRVADSYKYTGKDFNLIFNPQSSTFGGNATSVNEIIPYFAMVIVFLVASIVVAKKIGGTSASLGIAMTNKVRGGAQGVLAGGAGKFSKNKLDSWSTREDAPIRRGLARGATLLGVRDYADKQYKNSPQGKWAETRKKRASELANRTADSRLENNISAGLTALPGSQEQINFERSVQNANQSQLIDVLKEQTPGTDGYNRVVRAMSHAQVKGLLEAKNDVYDSGKQNSLREAYTTQTIQRMTVGTGNNGANRSIPEAITRGSAEDLAALGLPVLAPNAQAISAARMDDLRSKLTPTEYQNLTRERNNQLTGMMTSPTTRPQVFAGKSDREIARLPREVLLATDTNGRTLAAPFLNRNVLDIMLQGNSTDSFMNPGDRAQLRALISSGQVLGNNISDMNNWFTTPRGAGF